MDLRKPVLAIVCGGSTAPGINGIISSVTLEGLNQGANVIGLFNGFSDMLAGSSEIKMLHAKDVTRIHDSAGCMLGTSRRQLKTSEEADNCLRVLQHRRVRYLVTIGGVETARSVALIAHAARESDVPLSIVHVPKSIFNELPLPTDAISFGFNTAREIGSSCVEKLSADGRSLRRWYVVTCIGKKAGHLPLEVAKGSSATLCVIPEDYNGRKLTFDELCDTLEGAIYKRRAYGKPYGVAVLAEGLVDLMDPAEVKERWDDKTSAYRELSIHVAKTLNKRLNVGDFVVPHNLGHQMRGARPNAADVIATRDLGFAATRFLIEGGTDCCVTLKGGSVLAIPLDDMLEQEKGKMKVRYVDKTGISYQVAQNYMIRLRPSDLQDASFLTKLIKSSGLSREEFLSKFAKVALGL